MAFNINFFRKILVNLMSMLSSVKSIQKTFENKIKFDKNLDMKTYRNFPP